MASPDKGLSIRAYAKHRRELGLRGGTVSAVQRALASGRISRNRQGKIDPQRADDAWEGNTDQGRTDCRAGVGETPVPPTPMVPDYKTHRAIREAYAARMARLEYEKRAETLVEANAVRAEAFEQGRIVRDTLFSLPARLAPVFASEPDAGKIQARLMEELRVALITLSGAAD